MRDTPDPKAKAEPEPRTPARAPPLRPQWEAFAAARARGLEPGAAYLAAGYARHSGGQAGLEAREEIQARIKELTALELRTTGAGLSATIIALMRDAAPAQDKDVARACLREIRLTLLAASQLHALTDPPAPLSRPVELTDEEWVEKFGAR
jgi:hypothetical protein